jgi:Asp-tRNA(Asn)/Glu-tRNA(Gln) amidotransferase A subunit family amidase
MELCDLSAYQLALQVRQRQVSAVEVLESSLKRIAEVDGRPGTLNPGEITGVDLTQVHAFITLTAERARPGRSH